MYTDEDWENIYQGIILSAKQGENSMNDTYKNELMERYLNPYPELSIDTWVKMIYNGDQSDAMIISLVAQRDAQDDMGERLQKLTDAIDNFLNDTRERESVEELEQAMKDYGLSIRPVKK